MFFLVLNNILNADDPFQEFKVKRKNIFEFTKKPELKEEKNSTIISFAVKDFCDATIVIENLDGKIVRYLVSGVLGPNAPEPFKKNSLEQSIVWDNKDDSGRYLDDKASIRVRVSLGLQAEYEKDLYYSPYKRISEIPLLYASPEGIYVYEAKGRDHLRLFNHQGNYEKTIYPFPASQIKNVIGLRWIKAPDGREFPDKESIYHNTFLTSGENDSMTDCKGMEGVGVTGLAVKGKRIALAFENINRLSTDGSTGGLPLKGPITGFTINKAGYGDFGAGKQIVGPTSLAFSPDGKTVYLTGYMWQQSGGGYSASTNAVMKLNYETDDPMSVFAGVNTIEGFGNDNSHFTVPTSVETDKEGNVYVSDFINDRIQIFDANGKFLKTLNVNKPAKVLVHQKTGEIYVFSWAVIGVPTDIAKKTNYDPQNFIKKASVFSAYPEMKLKQEGDFPLGVSHRRQFFIMGQIHQVTLDSWSENPVFWIVDRKPMIGQADLAAYGESDLRLWKNPQLWESGIKGIELKNGKWVEICNFTEKTKKDIIRPTPPAHNIQYLCFNHKSEKLYVGEADAGPTVKTFNEIIEIDPISSKAQVIKLPFDPMDFDFDINGLIYMRTTNVIGRFDMSNWKEIPFDYGAEKAAVGGDGGMGGRQSPVISGIFLPARSPVCYHQGGMSVNVKGDIAVACHWSDPNEKNKEIVGAAIPDTGKYEPSVYPGRLQSNRNVNVHIWEKSGKVKSEDVIKGSPQTDGVFIDKDCNVYMLATPPRLIEGKPIDDGYSSTLIKFKNGSKGRFISSLSNIPLPLNKDEYPKSPQELKDQWVENYEWMYGGVGYGSFNPGAAGGGCACWHVRFKLDYLGRSFVPSPILSEVSVLDTAGNLILKIGKYGNEDSKGKNSKEPLGGDEVGLFHPCFTAVHTDRRLFISDIGNENILSVKLKYVVDEKVSFK